MSLVLNGSNYLAGDIGSLPKVAPLTISCWVKLPAGLDAWAVTLTNSSSVLLDVLVGRGANGRAVLSVRSLNAPPMSESATSVPVDTWFHLLATVGSVDQRQIALDGVAGAAQTDSTFPAGIDRISLGAIGWQSPVIAFQGRLAEIGLWTRVLNSTEGVRLAGGVRPTALSAGLAGYYPLLGDAAPTLGPSLTAFGAPAYDTVDHPAMVDGTGRMVRGQAVCGGAEAGISVTGGAVVGAAHVAGEVY